ncbi:MAG: hypothetical protein AAGL89_10880 [Pseudomonadota bacterium]
MKWAEIVMDEETNSAVHEQALSREKQFELLYWDFVTAVTDRKKTIFDLSRWIVTLHGLVIGFVALRDVDFETYFFIVPLLIGCVGLLLLSGLQQELTSHRKTVAEIRYRVGGDFLDLTQDHVNVFRGGLKGRSNYWQVIAATHWIIIIASTIVSVAAVLLSAN